MPWSTSELAELAGTTVNTIRHYHRLGLLDEPERRHNGYKQYGVPDLVRLLRIRRLAELGVPLSRIAEIAADGTPEALRQIDADHAAAIERLAKARQDITAILRGNAPVDAPPGFESVAARLSEADRSIIHIYTRIYDDDAMADLRRMVEADDPARGDIDNLPPDADEATRQNLAEKLAPTLARHLLDYPWLTDQSAHTPKGEAAAQQTVVEALRQLYNAAQLDVLHRAGLLAHEQVRIAREQAGADR